MQKHIYISLCFCKLSLWLLTYVVCGCYSVSLSVFCLQLNTVLFLILILGGIWAGTLVIFFVIETPRLVPNALFFFCCYGIIYCSGQMDKYHVWGAILSRFWYFCPPWLSDSHVTESYEKYWLIIVGTACQKQKFSRFVQNKPMVHLLIQREIKKKQ